MVVKEGIFAATKFSQNYGPLLIFSFQLVAHVVQKIFDLES
jgi:hypothetical protein